MHTPLVHLARCRDVNRAAYVHAVRQGWGFQGPFARLRCERRLLYGRTVRRECNDTFVKITNGAWSVFDKNGAIPDGDIAHQLSVAVPHVHWQWWPVVGCIAVLKSCDPKFTIKT